MLKWPAVISLIVKSYEYHVSTLWKYLHEAPNRDHVVGMVRREKRSWPGCRNPFQLLGDPALFPHVTGFWFFINLLWITSRMLPALLRTLGVKVCCEPEVTKTTWDDVRDDRPKFPVLLEQESNSIPQGLEEIPHRHGVLTLNSAPPCPA